MRARVRSSNREANDMLSGLDAESRSAEADAKQIEVLFNKVGQKGRAQLTALHLSGCSKDKIREPPQGAEGSAQHLGGNTRGGMIFCAVDGLKRRIGIGTLDGVFCNHPANTAHARSTPKSNGMLTVLCSRLFDAGEVYDALRMLEMRRVQTSDNSIRRRLLARSLSLSFSRSLVAARVAASSREKSLFSCCARA